MQPCWISNIQNFNFLTVGRVKRVNVRHDAKFRGDRSNRCWDVAIFRLWRLPPSWIFKIRIFYS